MILRAGIRDFQRREHLGRLRPSGLSMAGFVVSGTRAGCALPLKPPGYHRPRHDVKAFSTVRLAALAVAALVVMAYANHFQNGFHFDDSHAIVDNPFVRDLGQRAAILLGRDDLQHPAAEPVVPAGAAGHARLRLLAGRRLRALGVPAGHVLLVPPAAAGDVAAVPARTAAVGAGAGHRRRGAGRRRGLCGASRRGGDRQLRHPARRDPVDAGCGRRAVVLRRRPVGASLGAVGGAVRAGGVEQAAGAHLPAVARPVDRDGRTAGRCGGTARCRDRSCGRRGRRAAVGMVAGGAHAGHARDRSVIAAALRAVAAVGRRALPGCVRRTGGPQRRQRLAAGHRLDRCPRVAGAAGRGGARRARRAEPTGAV